MRSFRDRSCLTRTEMRVSAVRGLSGELITLSDKCALPELFNSFRNHVSTVCRRLIVFTCVWNEYMQYHQFQVVGRHLPTEADASPKVYRMKLWATDSVRAKSKFWYVSSPSHWQSHKTRSASIFLVSLLVHTLE